MRFNSNYQIEVTDEYALAMISALFNIIYTITLSWKVAKLRKIYFNTDFMEKNFGEIHRENFGKNAALSKLGYPDNGEGRYTDKLSYDRWFKFNIAQSVHQNSLEYLPLVLFAVLVCGLIFPK